MLPSGVYSKIFTVVSEALDFLCAPLRNNGIHLKVRKLQITFGLKKADQMDWGMREKVKVKGSLLSDVYKPLTATDKAVDKIGRLLTLPLF